MKKLTPHNKEVTLEYFRSLVAVAMADGVLKAEEEQFFKLKAKEFGFEIMTIEQMFEQTIEELIDNIGLEVDDIDYLTDLVAMCLVDGLIHEKEYDLVVKLAAKKDFSKDDVDKTANWLKQLM